MSSRSWLCGLLTGSGRSAPRAPARKWAWASWAPSAPISTAQRDDSPVETPADDRRHAAPPVPFRVDPVRTPARRAEPAHQTAALHRQHPPCRSPRRADRRTTSGRRRHGPSNTLRSAESTLPSGVGTSSRAGAARSKARSTCTAVGSGPIEGPVPPTDAASPTPDTRVRSRWA